MHAPRFTPSHGGASQSHPGMTAVPGPTMPDGAATGRGPNAGSLPAQPGSPPLTGQSAFTPKVARLSVAVVAALACGTVLNALLWQRPPATPAVGHDASRAQGAVRDGVVTGIRALETRAASEPPIKTSGLPAPPKAVSEDMRRWQSRLEQLEAEARVPVVATKPDRAPALEQPSGAVTPDALEPAIAHRIEPEPVAPLTQQTVRAIQRELTTRGYDPGPADGNIGLLTHAAIMAYEHDEDLPLTGEPSERLLRRIILGATGADDMPGRSGTADAQTAQRLVKGVQTALAALKYAPGRTDGTMTEETGRAIREFEMDQGLVPSGRVSGRLIVRLARASGKAFVLPVK